ncbi:hypothetical protein M3194_00005 [Paenibacillus glycanilyticus]|uniref:hypothetical protein n=1 Tax=Paenibacillus glycanilyticus TaxID=126569 RepID=UPI00203AD734|nr:hypothetical protein [Paenibacillus glycanilyticus]MCM3625741.1 hypothetical protein [Paenibacillus glycanilyticus]
MNFSFRSIESNKKLYSILIPEKIPNFIWFAEPVVSSRAIFANADGFTFIRDLFLIAAQSNKENTIYYVPIPNRAYKSPIMAIPEIQEWYKVGEYNLSLILFNYQFTHVDVKEAKTIISSLKYLPSQTINVVPDKQLIQKHIDEWKYWKLERTLNTKAHGKNLIIAADKQMLIHLAYQTDSFKNIDNRSKHNYQAHSHADNTGTSIDNGLNFFYYYPVEFEDV